jgi:nucleoside-diphosphate-sugar epimerase
MTTILITGANGFIGSHFGQRARMRGWRVLGADVAARDITGNCHDYREIDLGTPGAGDLLDTLPAPDVILHAGGISGFMVATDKPQYIVDVNVVGAMTLLEFARRRGARRTILCSTIMAYGPDKVPGIPRVETEYPEPISIYGASKVAIEALMHGHRAQYDTDAIALRFSHVYGPGRTTQCFVRDMLAAVQAGSPCLIPQAGSSLRQYVHIDDVCDAVDLAIQAAAPSSRVFNVSAGEIHSLAEVGAVIDRQIGKLDVCFDETIDLPHYRIGRLSLDKARAELGFSPALPLKKGLRSYWEAAFAWNTPPQAQANS